MKKRVIGMLTMMVCIVMLFSACGFGNAENEGDNIVATHSGEVLNKRYSAVKHATSTVEDLIDSYYDDYYYYYYFYLGEVNDVPLQSATEVPYYHYTGNNFTKAFKTTKTTTQSVEDSCTTAVTNTTTFSSTKNIKAGLNVKVATSVEAKISAGSFASASAKETFEFGVSVEAGYSRTTGNSDSTSRTNSYKQVATTSETTEETTGFGFTGESKIGYYRYIMTGSVDVYTVVVYSIADETFYLETLTEVMSFGYSFDYSESSRFDDNQCGSLEFDCSILNDLLSHIPTKALSENAGGTTPPQQTEDGTITSPYLIKSATDFYNIQNKDGVDRYFKLTKDIDFEKSAKSLDAFYGTLDGNGYTLKNYRYVISGETFSSEQNIGIIKTNYGTIKNIKVENVDIQSPTSCHNGSSVNIGGIIGTNATGAIIENVTVVNSTFIINRAGSCTGGIVGTNNGTVSGCTVQTTKFNSNGDCGGVVGTNNGTVSNATFIGKPLNGAVKNNTDDVMFDYWMVTSGSNGGGKSWGGIVGYNTANARILSVKVQFVYMYHHGDTSAKPKMGYLVGHNSGYIGGTRDTSYLGEYRQDIKGDNIKYYFANYDGLIGRNDSGSSVEFAN